MSIRVLGFRMQPLSQDTQSGLAGCRSYNLFRVAADNDSVEHMVKIANFSLQVVCFQQVAEVLII